MEKTIEDILFEALTPVAPRIADILVRKALSDIIEDFFRRYRENGNDFQKAKKDCIEESIEDIKKLKEICENKN